MKKTFAVFFMLVFLLSLGGFSAHAQAQVRATSFAYIPLVSPEGDTTVPVVFRARQAFNALVPRLLAAQAKGQIVRFEPEFNFGLLVVEYQAGFDLATALTIRAGATPPVFADPKSVLEYTHVSRSRTGMLMSPALPAPYMFVGVYDACFSGSNWGAGNMYEASLKDGSLRMLNSKTNYVDGSGNIDDCFYNTGIWQYMIPGYNFTLKIYDSTHTTLLATYTTVIPRLNITSITMKTKTFKGVGPANDQVWFEVIHEDLDAGNNETDIYAGGPTSSKGAWSIKLDSSAVIRGGDYYGIAWPNPDTITTTFVFYRGLFMPALDCTLLGDTCGVYGIPGKSAKITLTHVKKSYKTSGVFDFTGWFGGQFFDANTDPVLMVPGDKVVGTGAPTLYVPSLTAVPDTGTDTISGIAPASRYFWVKLLAYFHTTDEWKSAWRWTGSDTGGNYSADFTSSFAIDTADIIEASIYYFDPLTGNETDFWNYVLNE